MLNIDDWRIMYEGQEDDLVQLRASLVTAEKLAAENAEKAEALDWIIEKANDPAIDPREFVRSISKLLAASEWLGDIYEDPLAALQAARRLS
jgi:hypothetical protein